jgi:nicotinate-nucleotide adenylyltransferase
VADRPGLVVDPREVGRAGKSYTVLTLEELRQESPARPLLLLVGADAFLGFPTWHRWRELFALAHVVVAARPGVTLEPAGDLRPEWKSRLVDKPALLFTRPAGSIYVQAIAPMPASATEIRAQLARGAAGREAVAQAVPPAVLRYIDQHHLYSSPPPPQDAT